ncbi:SCP2 sterol-binding domain-containing protein [Virgibacillus dakarensis]|nr:SCP2 sterol-binding domain-containing protein [Virgibacillus dakarensis]
MAEIKDIFREIDAALKEDPSRTKGVKAIYQFDLDGGEAGVYQLILRGDDSYAVKGEKEKPDCTLKIASEDFEKMVEGNLNGTQAFMSGRLKIKGNMGLALKLQDILSSYNSATQ